MVKQCPRCWAKLSPGNEVCPNCGFEIVRRPVAEGDGTKSGGKRVVFPTARKNTDDWGFTLKLVYVLTIVWAVLAVLGGIYNLVDGDELAQGLGLLLSGILSGAAFYLIRKREHYFVASILVLVSGAATLQILLLVFAFILSFLLYSNAKFFKSM